MAQMNTDQLIQTALDLAGIAAAPPDARVWHAGTRISHVLIGLDLDAGDLFMARQLGYHGVVAYAAAADDPASLAGRLARLRANAERLPSVARLLDLPFVTLRSPLDALAERAIQAALDTALVANPAATAGDLRAALQHQVPAFAADPDAVFSRDGWDAPAGVVVAQLTDGHERLPPEIGTLVRAARPGDGAWLTGEVGAGNVLLLGRCAVASAGVQPFAAALRAAGIEVTAYSGLVA